MKQYQFKTLNSQPINFAPNPAFRPEGVPDKNIVRTVQRNGQSNPDFSTFNQEPNRAGYPYQAPQPQAQGHLNISEMKRKLDQLLQQTDRYESRKTAPGQKNQTVSNLKPRMTSPSPDPSFKQPQVQNQGRPSKLKNIQKYQKILQESKTTRQRFSATESTGNREWEANNYPKQSRLSSDSRYINSPPPPGYQQPFNNLKSSPQREDYNYNFNNNREPSYSQYPAQGSKPVRLNTQSPAKNEYNVPKIPLVQNPEKNVSFSYDNTSNSKMYSPKPEIKANNDINYGTTNYATLYSQSSQQVVKSRPSLQQPKQNIAASPKKVEQVIPGPDNQKLEMKLYELESKIKSLQRENQKLKQSVESAGESKEYYRSELSEERKNTNRVRDQYEQKIKEIKGEHSKQVVNLLNSINLVQEKCQKRIKNIEDGHVKKIQEMNQQIQKKQSKIVSLIKEIGNQQNNPITNQQLLQSREQDSQDFQLELQKKDNIINQLMSKLQSKEKNIQILQQKCREHKTQITRLTNFKAEVQSEKYSNFDSILMTQLATIKELKQRVDDLNEKNNELRTNIVEAERKIDSLHNQMKIIELKNRSEMNNAKTQEQIVLSNKQNIIVTLNRKMITLEQKIKLAHNDVKAKDQFIKQYLVGRADSANVKEHIETVLNKYKQSFSQSKEQQLTAELEKARKQIQLYEKYS